MISVSKVTTVRRKRSAVAFPQFALRFQGLLGNPAILKAFACQRPQFIVAHF